MELNLKSNNYDMASKEFRIIKETYSDGSQLFVLQHKGQVLDSWTDYSIRRDGVSMRCASADLDEMMKIYKSFTRKVVKTEVVFPIK